MTREEAINALRCLITMPGFTANEALDVAIAALRELKSPCDLCRYNPPSSCDGKPCTMCPASAKEEE